tara:strand:- start:648 stop:833 length:186 start_codon:yes stop_codon:yes gene_type:complete
MQTPIFPNTLNTNLEVLIEELDQQFPDVMPDLRLSEKEFAYRVGQVSVVRYLKNKLTNDEE